MADFQVKPKIEAIDKKYILENNDYIFSRLLIELIEAINRLAARLK